MELKECNIILLFKASICRYANKQVEHQTNLNIKKSWMYRRGGILLDYKLHNIYTLIGDSIC